MIKIENFKQAEEVLTRFERPASGVKYTLDTMLLLMEYLGNPQNNLRVIHVAGTSGKTSTSYFITSLLRAAGKTVGLSVSPHVDVVAERTQVNLELLPEGEYCGLLSEFIELVEVGGLEPSYFELLVAFSYWVFDRKKLDFAVMEVGLGGLLDATNVVDHEDKICVITDIGYDHMNILGHTLGKIAAQKGGIITKSNEVFMYQQSAEVMDVIEAIVQKKSATLHSVDLLTTFMNIPEFIHLPLFQQRNFTLSYTVVSSLITVSEEVAKRGMAFQVPGRMQVARLQDKTIIMDGSHNAQKIGALVDSIQAQYPDKMMTLILSFGSNREESMIDGLKILRKISDTIIVTTFESKQDTRQQSLATDVIAEAAKAAGFVSIFEEPDSTKAIEKALSLPSEFVLITGSFYLLKYVRAIVLK